MRTTTLFAGSALIWWTRSRRSAGASRSAWTRPLENWLSANHALRTLSRPTLTLHGPCSRGSLHWIALVERWARLRAAAELYTPDEALSAA